MLNRIMICNQRLKQLYPPSSDVPPQWPHTKPRSGHRPRDPDCQRNPWQPDSSRTDHRVAGNQKKSTKYVYVISCMNAHFKYMYPKEADVKNVDYKNKKR